MGYPLWMSLSIGLALGTLIGWAAWRARALSTSGAWAAALTGGLIFGLGGIAWAALLLTFFISSSALSRLFERRKAGLNEKFAKGSQRDWAQVFANGGLGALLVIPAALMPEVRLWGESLTLLAFVSYAGAMAAVNADTWATELGVLSPHPPRLITTGKVVERGTSGGVSWTGYAVALLGALAVAVVAALFQWGNGMFELAVSATLGGLAGTSFDSFLGATVQAIYFCPACEKETERSPLHTCGTPTRSRRGWVWLNNDAVNFGCALAGALTAVLCWRLLR